MLLNRSIKRLPPSKRHVEAKTRLTDMIAWLEARPPSKAMSEAVAHLRAARRVIAGAWPEFADLKPAPDPESVPPPVSAPPENPRPRNGGRFQRKEPTT